MAKIKSITAKAVRKTATPETWRRTWRTFLQVFIATVVGGIAALAPDWGTPQFKIGALVLVASAVGAALGAVMNLEDAPSGIKEGEADDQD